MIDPGDLDQPIRIERQGSAADSFTARTWELVAEVWASVRAVRAAEARRADSMQALLSHTVLVRWQRSLAVPLEAAEWRVCYADRMSGYEHVLAIVGPGRPLNDGGDWLIFDCLEGLADGH